MSSAVGKGGCRLNVPPCVQGQCIWVPHLSLIQVSGISLLFMINQEAIRRILLRSEKLATGFV